MQRPTVAVLLFLLVVSGYALAGFAVVGLASGAPPVDHGSAGDATLAAENVTVTGQVTDEDGQPVADAYVLLEPTPTGHLDEALAGDRTIAGMLLRFGMADVDGVTVAETDADGNFEATVPAGEYAVIAVAEESRAVSGLHTVAASGDVTVDLTVDPHRIVEVEQDLPGRVAPGETVTYTVGLENPDDRPLESLTMDLTLPDGWTVESVETGGEWDGEARRLHWDAVQPGERVEATLTIRVPEDTDRGSYPVEVSADSESHFVEHTLYDPVDVLPPGATPTETHTPTGTVDGTSSPKGGEAGTSTTTSTSVPATSSAPATDTPASAPGFGVVAGVVALALLAVRRR